MRAEMHNWETWITETDPQTLKRIYGKLLRQAGFGVLGIQEEHFQPQGYSCIFLLSESHFTIHTFPEDNRTHLQLTSCVAKQFNAFIRDYIQCAEGERHNDSTQEKTKCTG